MFEPEIVVRASRHLAESDTALLSYLRALTFDFERDGQSVSAVLVYAEPDPDDPNRYRAVVARETGFEGVACVDDTARAALLALGVYERNRSRTALGLARRWLTFVEYMQYPDGSFANFIRNAAGIRNATGPTSHRGGYWWSSRALWALARAYRVTGDARYLDRYQACKLAPLPDGKISAVLALGEMELYRAAPSPELRRSIMERCEIILQGHDDAGYFLDQPENSLVHLWGYHQLHAVASVAHLFEHPALLRACRVTIQNLIEPDIRARFWHAYPTLQKDGVCAYDVGPIVEGLAALHRATGAARYRDLALTAGAWFYGRNDARRPMYEPSTGRCRDGISKGVASMNFGAESSIEAGLAELDRRDLLSR